MKLDSAVSNYEALETVLANLKVINPTPDVCDIIDGIEAFLEPKRIIDEEQNELMRRASHGDQQAALELIGKMTEMNDGF